MGCGLTSGAFALKPSKYFNNVILIPFLAIPAPFFYNPEPFSLSRRKPVSRASNQLKI